MPPPLETWREIKQGSIDYVDGYSEREESIKGLKEKWEEEMTKNKLSDKKFGEEKTDKSLLDKWKSIGDNIVDSYDTSEVIGLKEKWDLDEMEPPALRRDERAKHRPYKIGRARGRGELQERPFKMVDIETLPPVKKRTYLGDPSKQNALIRRLKDIESSQTKILSLLGRIEDKYRNNKKCIDVEVHNSVVDDLNDLNMELSTLSDKAKLSLG